MELDLDEWEYAIQHLQYERVETGVKEKRMDPTLYKHHYLRFACRMGDVRMVTILLTYPGINPSDLFNSCIRTASRKGCLKLVDLLLSIPSVDPSDTNQYCLREACYMGHTDIVKRLLQDNRVCPKVMNHCSIRTASSKGHHEIVELLSYDPRVVEDIELFKDQLIRNAGEKNLFYLYFLSKRFHINPYEFRISHQAIHLMNELVVQIQFGLREVTKRIPKDIVKYVLSPFL
jgi:hypothetical protein